ncbi:CDP-diacylglycerol--glycerol-3-phosphate 3-phosphatidyltransferase, mitochondrial-like [Liolophura sinensis]|uniref:CDP-diacylglycerol--glycerol-3-phosphate 3-phosphatidyltransferase, mitochondrial-like n=1 Tax=Liolophura sinensis TaxID=3198878 RepID=UPI00315841C7
MKCCRPHAWLADVSPCFAVDGSQITILQEPSQFFSTLKEKTDSVKKRIVLASLYLGTGELEQELVDCLEKSCTRVRKEEDRELEVTVLLDFTRGSRGQVNSRTLLLPLLQKFEKSVSVSLYHTPDLRGFLKYVLPERYNETIGLTHLKVYLFDDSVIISGSNLSHDYFTNRQDRYILIENCAPLADFFTSLVKTVASFSFQLQTDNTVTVDESFGIHPFQDDQTTFKWAARDRVEKLLACESWRGGTGTEGRDSQNQGHHCDKDTWLYPLVQMGPLGITQDEDTMRRLLRSADSGHRIRLASGYFNLTDQYMDILLNQSLAQYEILMASPQVNGFYGARGMTGGIVPAYIYISKLFFQTLSALNQQNRIKLYEYYRNKWTFHVKGLWYYPCGKTLPDMTLIGSTNFGYRSVHRDLEAQLAIVTTNHSLRTELHKENERLYELSSQVTEETYERPDRHIPLWVMWVTSVIKHFF